MPKLPAIPPQKLAKVLEKKGFVLDRIRGSHHVYVQIDRSLIAQIFKIFA